VRSLAQSLRYAPAAGVLSFFLLYAVSAVLYPGGSQGDLRQPGFSLFHNYFCDLLRPIAYNGQPNTGRGVGLVAMALVAPTLALFWHFVVRLFPTQRLFVMTTRMGGYVSALATLLLVTPFHDSAVEIGGAFGLIAFFSTLMALPREKHGVLFAAGLAAAIVSSVCLFIWRSGLGLPALAGLQKLAFALFLTWVCAASLAAARAE